MSARGADGGRCIAMWSGPRNISTAMMRAWEHRADTRTVDEPLYAHFLAHTGLDHPMRERIVAAGETDWRTVVDSLVVPPATGIFYQKHITTHWMPHFTLEWLDALDHAFLIRAPEAVVASYGRKRKGGTLADLGYAQAAALFEAISQRRGEAPPVIDGDRFLAAPEAQLRALCGRLGVGFEPAMLGWPAGRRDSDGVWGEHWYDAVERSIGFAPPRPAETIVLDDGQRRISDRCRPYHEALAAYAIETS